MPDIGTNTSDVIIEPTVGVLRTSHMETALKPQFQLWKY